MAPMFSSPFMSDQNGLSSHTPFGGWQPPLEGKALDSNTAAGDFYSLELPLALPVWPGSPGHPKCRLACTHGIQQMHLAPMEASRRWTIACCLPVSWLQWLDSKERSICTMLLQFTIRHVAACKSKHLCNTCWPPVSDSSTAVKPYRPFKTGGLLRSFGMQLPTHISSATSVLWGHANRTDSPVPFLTHYAAASLSGDFTACLANALLFCELISLQRSHL